MRRPRLCATLVTLALLSGGGFPWIRAGEGRPPIDDATVDRLLELHRQREEQQVRLVLLPASVTTRGGRRVRGLQIEDFRLYEDTIPQEISYFTSEAHEPIAITFLLDLSGSMAHVGKLEQAKRAIRFFVDALRPEDTVGLIGFADDQVAWITETTSDRERFLLRLQVQEGYGPTALYDAIAAAPGLVDSGAEGRKALVLITDGADNASEMNTFQAMTVARQVNVPIYCIGFSFVPRKALARGSRQTIFRVLELFSRETGGLVLPVNTEKDLGRAVARIEEDLRFHYLIGYYPTRDTWDGTFRRVKLETDRDSLEVRTRRGYYATP
jgi:Ca-activated chloride channel family protein